MTTSLKLTYTAAEDLGPVLVNLFNYELEVVGEATLSKSNPSLLVPVKPGSYSIRVRQVSGTRFEVLTRVEEGETKIVNVEPHSPIGEALGRASTSTLPNLADNSGKFSDGTRVLLRPTPFQEIMALNEGIDLEVSYSPTSSRPAWARVLEASDNPFRPAAWSVTPPHWVGPRRSNRMTLLAPANRSAYVQLGGENIPWRCVALPPSPRPVIVSLMGPNSRDLPLGLGNSNGPQNRFRVELSLGGDLIDSMLHSLLPSEHDAPDAVADQVATTGSLAEELLRGKFEDTAAGVVGGYFLLDRCYHDRLHDWPRNLANSFPWLADGPVLHGWQILRDPDPSRRDPKKARASFLESFRRGLPVFSYGLRLLKDGLGYFAMVHHWGNDPPFVGEHDDEVFAALNSLAPYLAALDPSATSTTFTGRGPAEPSVEAIEGRPTGPVVDVVD